MGICLCSLFAGAETVTLYSEDKEGGIHETSAEVVVHNGEYYLELPLLWEGISETWENRMGDRERVHVCRVKDSITLLLHQPQWSEKYPYAAEQLEDWDNSITYYFDMKSPWKKSWMADPKDPNNVIPLRRLSVYRDDGKEGGTALKAVLLKYQDRYQLYFELGVEDILVVDVEKNSRSAGATPGWAKKYKYSAEMQGHKVYFNLK